MTLKDQHRRAALVTGAAVRLGKAIALSLAENGFDIALHYHSSAAEADSTAEKIRETGVSCEIFQTDLAKTGSLDALMTDVVGAFPGLDVLVNNASVYHQAPLMETAAEDFQKQFSINLQAPVFLTQAFARRGAGGLVINILDNKIAYNQFQYTAYLLSKKALAEFTRMAALELAPDIRVNGIAPGVILPAHTRSQEYIVWRCDGIPLKRKGEVRDITRAVRYLVESDFVSGQVLTVDGAENVEHVGLNAGDFDQDLV